VKIIYYSIFSTRGMQELMSSRAANLLPKTTNFHTKSVHALRPTTHRFMHPSCSARLSLLAKAQASIPRPAALHLNLYPSYHILFPFNEPPRARLLLSLRIGASRLEKHKDAMGLDQVFRSVSGEKNSGFWSSRAS
jgi:hypothetical protein